MRVGLIAPSDVWASLSHVRQITSAALTQHHELHPFPSEYPYATQQARAELLQRWLRSLDVLVGPLNHEVVQARRKMPRPVPWMIFILGAMPRGAYGLSEAHRNLYTSDVLVCNCTADLEMSVKVFPNATCRLIPFAYDDAVFYPATDATRLATRRALGLEVDEPLLLYSGRFTIEKNVHSAIKVLRVVLEAVPSARLLLVGGEMRAPFSEFGAIPISTNRLLHRVRTSLGLSSSQVMMLGHRPPAQLRDLYSAVDVLVNLTLHHDENFGLAQVEAMACGLPGVVTAWGGLKDTVIDGVTGAHVPTTVTATGVKVDWWAAANSIVRLLANGGPTPEMKQRCRELAVERYSLGRYAARLDEVIRECTASPRAAEPLTHSGFAAKFWDVCAKAPEEPPPYRRGEAAMCLYRQLIEPYAAGSDKDSRDSDEGLLILSTPVAIRVDNTIEINDPIFPFELEIPESLQQAVRHLVDSFSKVPVQNTRAILRENQSLRDALVWLRQHGLLLPTREGDFTPDWTNIPIGQPTLRLQHVDHQTDLVWFS